MKYHDYVSRRHAAWKAWLTEPTRYYSLRGLWWACTFNGVILIFFIIAEVLESNTFWSITMTILWLINVTSAAVIKRIIATKFSRVSVPQHVRNGEDH